MTRRPENSIVSFVTLSMTRTPVALLVRSSISTSETTESGRTVRLPLSRAGKISAAGEWKAALRSQPRPQRPRPMQRARYLLFSTPSVVTPARPGISLRPIFAMARCTWTSPQFSLSGRWKMPSGRCGMCSRLPEIPSSVSTLS